MIDKQIFYHDTDSGGVVYYANYLKYFEEARTRYLEIKGEGVPRFLEQGFFFAVRSCALTYKAPARYNDMITVDAVVEKVTGAQITFRQRVYKKDTGETLVTGEVVLVCVGMDFKPRAIPAALREKLI